MGVSVTAPVAVNKSPWPEVGYVRSNPYRRSGALSVDAGAAEKLSPLVSGSPTIRSAPTGGHRATGITSSWRQSARGPDRPQPWPRGGAGQGASFDRSPPGNASDGGIDDACPAITATP